MEVRLGFIRKVYSLLALGLLITFAVVCIPMFSSSVRTFLDNNIWIFITALVIAFVIEIAVFCCLGVSRKVPVNYGLMFGFIFCESIVVAYCCGAYNREIVFMAAGMTAGLVTILTVYAMTTKKDFTLCMSTIWIFGGLLLMWGIMAILFRSQIMYTIYCAAGVCIFSIYLMIDTQLIMGNKRYKLSEDDYVIGVLILYIDIIMIFLYLLQLLGKR